MTLAERLVEYVRACFTGLWIQSHEHHDALVEIAQLCRQNKWQLATWNVESGLQVQGTNLETGDSGSDPLAAIRSLAALPASKGTTLLVLENLHRFLQSAEVVQALAGQVVAGKQNRTFVVVLSPVVQIPVELEKLFIVLEHDLPTRKQLVEIASGIATEDGEFPDGPEREAVLDAAAGLTRYEAEGAFSLSLVRHRRVAPDVIWELKSQMLKKSGLLSLHRGQEKFDALGGLTALKAFALRALRRPARNLATPRPRGLLLLGVSGTGKSAFCKALGNEIGRPTLVLDIGGLLGSLVGQSEQNVRQALRIADAMAPCVIFVDELEKALSGVNGQGDSGVSTRLFGTLLSWLNDHETDVMVVCSANDVSRLPPEFTRAERFDAVYFLDLPGAEQREAIWRQYLAQYQLDPDQAKPENANWTGAEIKSCCRLAALLDVPLVHAAQNVVPVAVTAAESVERLRTWASGRCLDAEQPGIYQRQARSEKQPAVRRRVNRDPSNN
jgi:hypothetical protein